MPASNAIARGSDGAILREAAAATPGDAIAVRLARGELDARVDRVRDSSL